MSLPPELEVPCKLVEVAGLPCCTGRQGGKRRQCILAALRHQRCALTFTPYRDAADEFGLGEVEFLQAYAIRSFSSAVTLTLMMCLSFLRRVIAVLSSACSTFISVIFDLL